jgi:arylsulfatase A-like enzyme
MPQNALVLAFDRLQTGYLGPYGNNTVPTPAWNALAAESLLLENHLADSNDLASTYRAWWSGGHVWSAGGESLAEALEEQGIHAALVTDEPALLEHPLAERFAERIVVRHDDTPQSVEEPHECQLAQVLAAALSWLEDKPPQPFLCWVHARAMSGPWDAPYDMRLALTDDDDPDPPTSLTPPELELPADYNPDELLGHTQAYGGQVMLADMCLGMFLEEWADHDLSRNTLLACTSPRGYPLGEHRLVGCQRELLTSEAMHVPLVIRFPQAEAAAVRERSLTQPADLYATLRDWFELEPLAESPWRRSLLPLRTGMLESARQHHLMASETQVALRTAEWLLIIDRNELNQPADSDPFVLDRQTTAMYSKPDDRWEFNNVYQLCMREANALMRELVELRGRV